MSDVGPWNRILLRHVKDGFGDDASIATQWRELNFTAAPDYGKALEQYERFVEALSCSGAPVLWCSCAVLWCWGAGVLSTLHLSTLHGTRAREHLSTRALE